MSARSRASAHWEGSTTEGSGTVSTASDALRAQPLYWASRIGEQEGTTPEELLAASWAGCFSMAFGFALTNAGAAPRTLDVDAELAFVAKDGGGFEIGKGKIDVRVAVDLDEEKVGELAEQAKVTCPVSVALGKIADDAKLSLQVSAPTA